MDATVKPPIAGCAQCIEIMAAESRLDVLQTELELSYNRPLAEVRAENRKRWEKFARLCRLPLVGRLYRRLKIAPKLVKDWFGPQHPFWQSLKDFEHAVRAVEQMKCAHLDHWGDEIVETAHDEYIHDPPNWEDLVPRRTYCADPHRVFCLPERREALSSAAYHEGEYVMCFSTLAIVPVKDCNCGWCLYGTRGKTIYWLRTEDRPTLLGGPRFDKD